MNQYYYKKSKFYYETFLQNKYVKKVCAIIRDKNKFLVLINNNKVNNVGGTVENNESTKEAIIREVFEETNGLVEKIRYLTKSYYSVEWEFENKKFLSKRVEYFYLCELKNTNLKIKGLKNEFSKNINLKWCTIEELEYFNLNSTELNIIKNLKF